MASRQGESTDAQLILIGLGANLPSRFGPPRETLEAALQSLRDRNITITRRSRYWRSAPVPISDQPWYLNGVVAVATRLAPGDLLMQLHHIEADFGRVRGVRDAPRLIDLDILAYGRRRSAEAPILPHPRMADRAFVLLPLAEIAPDWRHPESGKGVAQLIADLPPGQQIEPVQG